MAEEYSIIKVGTEESVTNIQDLKNNIKQLKGDLETLDIGSEEYQKTLKELNENQNALKDAMYASSASMGDLAKAAKGQSQSYNSLVNQMKQYKSELRNIDTSTEEGKEKFRQMAASINEVNDRLKEMDAMQGNFQRNVGNYESGFKGLADATDALDKGLKVAHGGVSGLKGGLEALAKSPWVAAFGILVSVLVNTGKAIKENSQFTAAWKKAGESFKPVLEFFSFALDKLGNLCGQLLGYATDLLKKGVALLSSNGLLAKSTKVIMGVGNSIIQFILTPIRAVANIWKAIKEKGFKEGLSEIPGILAENAKKAISFKKNYEIGEAFAENIAEGTRIAFGKYRLQKKMSSAISEAMKNAIGEADKEIQSTLDNELEKIDFTQVANDDFSGRRASENTQLENISQAEKLQLSLNKIFAKGEQERYDIQSKFNKLRLDKLEEFRLAALESGDVDAAIAYDKQIEELKTQIALDGIEAREEAARKAAKAEKDREYARLETMFTVADTTSSILSSIADMYDSDEESAKKNAKKIKALRIASATIDTISGAIGAYMSACKTIPAPYGQIVGIAQASAITAAGMANIASIKKTRFDGGESGAIGYATSAPSYTPIIEETHNITGTREFEQLNALKDQKVYILQSDIEASSNARKARVQESTF